MPVHKFITKTECRNVRTRPETVITIENISDSVVTMNEEDAVLKFHIIEK
jgi:hypothetical protein